MQEAVLLVLVDDVLCFYVSFEILLVLIYCYLVQRVTTERATYALLLLVVYTIVGSSLMATGYVLLYVCSGTTSTIATLTLYTQP